MTDSTSEPRSLDQITGADLQTVTFASSKGFGRGYDQHEVDAFVQRCATLVDGLQRRLAEVTAGYESQVAELRDRIDRDSRSNEVAQAMSVLITAQQTADTTVAQADEYSAKVMAEARELYEDTRKNAATLEQETEDKARHVYQEALSRAEAIEREAADRVERMNLNSESVQADLDQQTAYLRTLRDTSRIQIQTFLEGLLDHVAEEYGRAHPIAAEAATEATANAKRAKRSGRGKPAARGARPAPRVAGLTPVRRGSGTVSRPAQPGAYPQSAYEPDRYSQY
ncbi:DivIVA domain-containing protein [Nakamurella sp.]|uniref:DivIVA domain-containing protein n=1 Tax=Nakamurella sp. TaxID=1869182 RepID=UPI003B3AE12A